MMIEIELNKEHMDFITPYAKKLDLGGKSNLTESDLAKASRFDFQCVGLAGEVAFYLYRYKQNGISKFKETFLEKEKFCKENNSGDQGFDDILTFNGKTRFIDIKTSFVTDEKKIDKLNLIVPEKEFHQNQIYISAIALGKSRSSIYKVFFTGWAISEDFKNRWERNSNAFCIPIKNLRSMKLLENYLK